MALAKELRPIQSKKLYAEKSKDNLKNVSIGAGKEPTCVYLCSSNHQASSRFESGQTYDFKIGIHSFPA